MAVEARGSGFIKGTDLPAILFEGHKFCKFTGGTYDKSHPSLSYSKWTKEHYAGGRGEYKRIAQAAKLDTRAALRSASWGLFQIMGFNHRQCGFLTVEDFVNEMSLGEDRHLHAFVEYILADDAMARTLRSEDWADFARRYNGPGYKANQYDTKLAAEFAKARAEPDGLLRGDLAAVQAALNIVMDIGLTVDGWMGPKTRGAILAYQEVQGLPLTGEPDEATREALGLGAAEVA